MKEETPQNRFLQSRDLIREVEGYTQEWLIVGERTSSRDDDRVQLVKVRINNSFNGKEEIVVEEAGAVRKVENRFVAGHHNGVIAVAETTEDGEVVLRYGVGSDKEKIVPLPEPAHCLHVAEKAVYLGFASSVGWVDFSKEQPKYVELVQKQHPSGKSYDMFARSDDLLIAVDDIMLPFFGDSFRLGVDGPVHEKAFQLPSLINGSYKLAELVNQDYLLLVSVFGHMGGHGRTLHRLSIAEPEGTDIFRGIKSLQECENYSGKILKSLSSSATNTGLSSWVDLAVHNGNNIILIAAEERGLLALPVHFEDAPKAVVLLKGNCSAARVLRDDSIWAIMSFDEDDFHGLVKVNPLTGDISKRVPLGDTLDLLL